MKVHATKEKIKFRSNIRKCDIQKEKFCIGKYKFNNIIIAGERRWRAARLAGLDEVPVIIKDVTDEQAARCV